MYKPVYAPLALGVDNCRHLFPEEAIHNYLWKISLGVLKVQIVATINFGKKHKQIITMNNIKILIIAIFFTYILHLGLFKNSVVSFFKDFRRDIQKVLMQNSLAANVYFKV